MKYNNPYYRRVKGSHTLIISCGHCKTEIAEYQKLGRGNLLRMYVERITRSSVDLLKLPRHLVCPNCEETLAMKIYIKESDQNAYRMIRSAYNTKEVDY